MPKKLYNEVEPGELMWMDWLQSSGKGRVDKVSRPTDQVKKGVIPAVRATVPMGKPAAVKKTTR
ncbi:MAG: hypothetical protein V2A66_09435 [Pseudomonadota bacterium]